jgi:hypothetical protein
MGTNKEIGISINVPKLRQSIDAAGREFDRLSDKMNSSDPRESAEDLFSSFVSKARGYTTSAAETMRSINDQQRSLFQKREADRQEALERYKSIKEGRSKGTYDPEDVSAIMEERRNDKRILAALQDIIHTTKSTAREEIISDRENVEKLVGKSTTVNKLVKGGDAYQILKETFQQKMLGSLKQEESNQRSWGNFQNTVGTIRSVGGNLAKGNISGAASGLIQPIIGFLTKLGPTGLLVAGGLVAALITTTVAFSANSRTPNKLRDFAIATQTGTDQIYNTQQDIYRSGVYKKMGLTAEEFLQGSAGFYRATGGRNLSAGQLAGLTGITRSRDVSSELLNQTLGFSRYDSSGGSPVIAIKSLENTLRAQYRDDDEYKRKLVQLPEMMTAYNNIASSVLATTGRVDQARISNFVGNVSQQFGVEGSNLQRYSSGISRMMSKSGNSFVNMMQMKVVRDLYPGLSNADLYQKTLEIQADPTSNPEYMKAMYSEMKRVGGGKTLSPEFRSWAASAGFSPQEAKEMFGKGFDPTRTPGSVTQDETTVLSDYVKSASEFYSKTETWQKEIKDWFVSFGSQFGDEVQNGVKKGTEKAWGGIPYTIDPPKPKKQ